MVKFGYGFIFGDGKIYVERDEQNEKGGQGKQLKQGKHALKQGKHALRTQTSQFRFQTRRKLVSLDQHFNLYVFSRRWDNDLLSPFAKLVFYRVILHAPVIAI